MWFDARAKLAEIVGHAPATSAPAQQAAPPRSVSQLSQVSQPADAVNRVCGVANVASVATPKPPRPGAIAPNATKAPPSGDCTHGTACDLGLYPRTWTGRVVSLAEWRALSAWDRHGPDGRIFNGLSRRWEPDGGA